LDADEEGCDAPSARDLETEPGWPHPEQGYRSCLGIIGLEKRFGAERLEAAALRALEIQARNYPSIKSILEKGLDQVPVPQSPEQEPIIHSNIRGSSYYN